MLIDGRGRLFGKLNIIDAIVIILVIVAVGGVGYKLTKSKSLIQGNTDKVCVEFYSEEAPEFAPKKVREGDVVVDTERGTNFGIVASIKIDKAASTGQAASGAFVPASRPGYSSVLMQVYGDGIVKPDGGITMNSIDYYVGKTIIMRAGTSTFVGRIYNLSKRG